MYEKGLLSRHGQEGGSAGLLPTGSLLHFQAASYTVSHCFRLLHIFSPKTCTEDFSIRIWLICFPRVSVLTTVCCCFLIISHIKFLFD